jgi:folylpolyglutamate synthase
LTLAEALGLRLTSWPGRSHEVKYGKNVYFLDGAHTEQSMWACQSWFQHVWSSKQITSKQVGETNQNKSKRVLIFNSTGDRKAEVLLAPLLIFNFDLAIFCTNVTKQEDLGADNTNLNYSLSYALKRCDLNKTTWDQLQDAKIGM